MSMHNIMRCEEITTDNFSYKVTQKSLRIGKRKWASNNSEFNNQKEKFFTIFKLFVCGFVIIQLQKKRNTKIDF